MRKGSEESGRGASPGVVCLSVKDGLDQIEAGDRLTGDCGNRYLKRRLLASEPVEREGVLWSCVALGLRRSGDGDNRMCSRLSLRCNLIASFFPVQMGCHKWGGQSHCTGGFCLRNATEFAKFDRKAVNEIVIKRGILLAQHANNWKELLKII